MTENATGLNHGDDKSVIAVCDGSPFSLTQAESGDVKIEHIAHALANLCRWTGHLRQFYSVAEHCVLVSYIVPHEHALQGLLHDAAEAYLGDLSSPLKAIVGGRYRELETRLSTVIMEKYGLTWPMHETVKWADGVSAAMEKRDLLAPADWFGGDLPDPLDSMNLFPVGPRHAEAQYLRRFKELVTWEEIT